jgi:hypothetical protein
LSKQTDVPKIVSPKFLSFVFFLQILFSCSDKTEWKTFTSKEGGFSVDFPGTPKDTTFLGGVSLQNEFSVRFDNNPLNSYYKVNYIQLPSIPDLYNGGEMDPCSFAKGLHQSDMQYYALQLEGTLREGSKLIPGKYDAEEFKVDFKDKSGLVTVRKICAGGKLYTLMVISHAGKEDNELTTKFFNSFVVLK